MTFDIRKLDNLSDDDIEPLLVEYIDDVIQEFVDSNAGKAHIKEHPVGGDWIGTFIEMGYLYLEKTLPKMPKSDAQELMEYTLPRKITLMDRSDTDGAVEELIAFWRFLKETYKFRSAGTIVKYLTSIKDKFADWMFDPSRGGIAKSFMMQGTAAGHDMTTQEGIEAFQKEYNQKLKTNPASNLLAGSPFGGQQLAPMVAPPEKLRGMLEMLGVDLPEEGTMVNPMELLANIRNAVDSFEEEPTERKKVNPLREMILGGEGDIPDLADCL